MATRKRNNSAPANAFSQGPSGNPDYFAATGAGQGEATFGTAPKNAVALPKFNRPRAAAADPLQDDPFQREGGAMGGGQSNASFDTGAVVNNTPADPNQMANLAQALGLAGQLFGDSGLSTMSAGINATGEAVKGNLVPGAQFAAGLTGMGKDVGNAIGIGGNLATGNYTGAATSAARALGATGLGALGIGFAADAVQGKRTSPETFGQAIGGVLGGPAGALAGKYGAGALFGQNDTTYSDTGLVDRGYPGLLGTDLGNRLTQPIGEDNTYSSDTVDTAPSPQNSGSGGPKGGMNEGNRTGRAPGTMKDGGMVGLTQRYADGGPLLAMGFAQGGQVQMGASPTNQSATAQVNAILKDPRQKSTIATRAQQLMASGELTQEEVTTMARVAEASMYNPELYPQLREFVAAQGMTPLPPTYDPSVIARIMAIARILQEQQPVLPPGEVPPMDQAAMEPAPGTRAGGMIRGPGTGRSDSIGTVNKTTKQPVAVANGEYVIPQHIVAIKGREFFDNLIRRYADAPKENA